MSSQQPQTPSPRGTDPFIPPLQLPRRESSAQNSAATMPSRIKAALKDMKGIERAILLATITCFVAALGFVVSLSLSGPEQNRLEADVAQLNTAIASYLKSGGSFTAADVSSPEALLVRLRYPRGAPAHASKTELAAAEMRCFSIQRPGEANYGTPRARLVSDPNQPRFEIVYSGPPGIGAFRLEPPLPGTGTAGSLSVSINEAAPGTPAIISSKPARRQGSW